MTARDKIHEAFTAISDDLNKTRAEFARQARNMDGLLNALESFTTGVSSQGSIPTIELQTPASGTSHVAESESTGDFPKYLQNVQPPPPLPVEEPTPLQPEEDLQQWEWSGDAEFAR